MSLHLGLGSAAGALDDPQTDRRAGRDLLSLALIDSRNHLLQRLAAIVDAPELGITDRLPALRLAAQAGWFAEHWINGFVQRSRGEAADPVAIRLGSIQPQARDWGEGRQLPSPQTLRAYLQQTLEDTLDLLAQAEDSDTALHFFRLALRHEDRLVEALGRLALGLAAQRGAASAPPARPERAALWLPAQAFRLGSERAGDAPGCVPEGERWAHALNLPDFEIDAQAVSWARFSEFALDGGYDREDLWTRAGWAWLQQDGRRAPLGVAQFAGGVVLERAGRLQRVPPQQPVVGVTRFEAQAWCHWAGRRLPTEPEWELAACTASARGFAWGDVLEWVAGSARPWPGHEGVRRPVPGDIDPLPAEPKGRDAPGLLDPVAPALPGVQRGASWLALPRARHPRARRFVPDSHATMDAGFRSCGL